MITSLNSVPSARSLFAVVAVLAGTTAGCTRDEIISVDPGRPPGQTSETVEAVINTTGLATWTDTSFFGFSRPSDAPYVLMEEGSSLTSRTLARFGFIRTTVFTGDTTANIIRYDSTAFVVTIDTARSNVPAAGATLRLQAVDEAWDARSADWNFAVDTTGTQIPWSVPGAALGTILAETVLSPDTAQVSFDLSVIGDSLLKAWADTMLPNTGVAIVVLDSTRLLGLQTTLSFQAVPETDPDTLVLLATPPTDRTFIFDPEPLPPTPDVLRIGGVDGWRIYTELVIPDSVTVSGGLGNFSIAGVQIHRAELVLRSLAPPAAPFTAEGIFFGFANRLADDFKVLGEKTPLADAIPGSEFEIDPDTLTAGSTVRINLTGRLQQLADSLERFGVTVQPRLRVGLRALPEGATFGYWEFGGTPGDTAFDPIVRLVFTPDTDFGLPE